MGWLICGSVAEYCRVWLVGSIVCNSKKLCTYFKHVLVSGILDLDCSKSNNDGDGVYLYKSIVQSIAWIQEI